MLSNIELARAKINALRLALTGAGPEEMAAALTAGEDAARYLEMAEQDLRDGVGVPDRTRRELKLLKSDLRISARLTEHGLAFCRGWANLIGAGSSYTPAGKTAPNERFAGSGGTLSLRG
jgi:hypothetical protein